MKTRSLTLLAAPALSGTALAYGPWLDWTPTGGVEIGGPDAVDRATRREKTF